MSVRTPTRPSPSAYDRPPSVPPRAPRRVRRRPPAPSPRQRSSFLLVAFLMILSLFAGRLVELQGIRADELAAQGLQQRLQAYEITADRGTIYDSQGHPLAQTVEVRNITADQTMIRDKAETASILASILQTDSAKLKESLTGEKRYVVLEQGVEPAKWRAIQDRRAASAEDSAALEGIFSEKDSAREYPNGTLAANVIGFTNAEGKGATGLEYGLEPELSGPAGRQEAEYGPDGSVIPGSEITHTAPVAGTGVRLTIDSDLQWVAQNSLAQRVKDSKADFGMAIAMEVGTGRILAMATVPTFDPNDPSASPQEDWTNRPATYAFEPGSTMKVLTHSAIIDGGAATPATVLTVPPGLTRGGHVITDHTPHGTLRLTLAGVLAESSNLGTILAAEQLGPEKFYQYLQAFGAGQTTGLQFPGESQGIVPDPASWSALTFPSMAYGQGLAMTALQLTQAYAAVANSGVLVQPKLIDSYVRPDGTVQLTAASPSHRVIEAETAHQVVEMMERVVSPDGTAPKSGIPGYRVGGKTGTAERADPTCGCYRGYTASFIGTAPADNPRVVVGVWIDNPRAGHYGGVLGGPVFTEITKAALADLDVPPSGSAPATIPTVPTVPTGV